MSTGIHTDWWYDHRELTQDEVDAIERRAAHAGTIVDELIGGGRPGLRVVRACHDCGDSYESDPVVGGTPICPSCRSRRGTRANAAKRGG